MAEKNNFKELPTVEELSKIVTEIENADFSLLSYNKLISKLRSFRFIPFPIAKLNKGYHIERARINKPDEIFKSEREISYRTDYENILEFGRANAPKNSLFYGAIESDAIKHPRLVNLLETSEIFRNLHKTQVDKADFVMTLGKWRIKDSIDVAEVVFDEQSINNSEDVKKSFEFHKETFQREIPDNIDQFELILKFFSSEFAKKPEKIKNHFDYMVSAAYTDLAINMKGLQGIKFPSVRTDYQGHNIVLTRQAVENNLELEIAAMFRVFKDGERTIVSTLKHATDFGHLNTNFNWVDVEDKTSELEP